MDDEHRRLEREAAVGGQIAKHHLAHFRVRHGMCPWCGNKEKDWGSSPLPEDAIDCCCFQCWREHRANQGPMAHVCVDCPRYEWFEELEKIDE